MGDYGQFRRFFREHQSIKSEVNIQRLLTLAKQMAVQSNDEGLQKCAQHVTLLYKSQQMTSRGMTDFLEDLEDNERAAISHLQSQVAKVLRSVRESVQSSLTSPGYTVQQSYTGPLVDTVPPRQAIDAARGVSLSRHQGAPKQHMSSIQSSSAADIVPAAGMQNRHAEYASTHQSGPNEQLVDDFRSLSVSEKPGKAKVWL